jgi:ATP-dependent 26S proteasome regulatory subunit
LPRNTNTISKIKLICSSNYHNTIQIQDNIKDFINKIYQDYCINYHNDIDKKREINIYSLKVKRTFEKENIKSYLKNYDNKSENNNDDKNDIIPDNLNDNTLDKLSDNTSDKLSDKLSDNTSDTITDYSDNNSELKDKKYVDNFKNISNKSNFNCDELQLLSNFNRNNKPYFNNYSYYHNEPKLIEKIDYICEKQCSVFKDISNLFLRKNSMKRLKSILKNFKENKDIYDRMDITHKMGLLLHGIPGTGKTTTIKAVASYLGMDIYFVDLKDIKTNDELNNLVKLANSNSQHGSIIVFEDIDAMTNIVLKRDDINYDNNRVDDSKEFTLSGLLNIMDGLNSISETVFIISTNHLEKLDPAIYRKGRIDALLEFLLCDKDMCKEIFQTIMKKELDNNVYDKIIEDKFTPADVIFTILPYTYNSVSSDEEIMADFIK